MFMFVMHSGLFVMDSRTFVMRSRLWLFLGRLDRLCRRLGFPDGAHHGSRVTCGHRHSSAQVRHDCEKHK